MSASHHLSGQMEMFIPAGRLADPEQTHHNDAMWHGGFDNMVKEKHEGALHKRYPSGESDPHGGMHYENLVDSIKRQGVQSPVEMSAYEYTPRVNGRGGPRPAALPRLLNGHHRTFTANALDPKTEVPVRWVD